MKTIQELANEASITYSGMSYRIKKLNIPVTASRQPSKSYKIWHSVGQPRT